MASFQIDGCDNIWENFVGAGSTTITLGGAVSTGHPFSSKYAAGDTFWGTARGVSSGEESIGLFTYNGTTVTQTLVKKSSNGGAPVAFSNGSQCQIFVDVPGWVLDHLNFAGITVTSAGTFDIGAAQGTFIVSSGTGGPVTSLGTSPHKFRIVVHSGATWTCNTTSLILLGLANAATIVMAAGTVSAYHSDSAGNWRELWRSPAAQTGSGATVLATAPDLINPTVTTQSQGDNSTKAASTAYTDAAVAAKGTGVSIVPVWSGGGTPPSLGNGTLTGKVTRLGPALIFVTVKLTIGSTSTMGTSFWTFTLPAPYNGAATAFGGGNANMFHSSNFGGYVTNASGATGIFPFTTSGTLVSATVPFTWAAGDTLEFSFLMTGP